MLDDWGSKHQSAIARIDEFGRHENRTYITLNGLDLRELPPQLFNLATRARLQRLDLQGNRLVKLPAEIGHLSQLSELDISRNLLATLPPEIGLLAKLRILNASDNKLTGVPHEIGQLTSLEELFLLRNQLTELPPHVGKMANLRELYLWGNQLTALPRELGALRHLSILNLSVNQLASLPRDLLQLTNLRELYLHHNFALRMPAEVLGASSASAHFHRKRDKDARPADPARILKLYFATQQHPLLEARLIIVGDGGVGKTSLARQLVHSALAEAAQQATRDVAIEPWHVRLRGSDVQVHIWDFGGQEPMHAAHPYFFTERSLYLVVASSRDAGVEERLDYWLTAVGRFGAGARTLCVVNKVDLNSMDIDRSTLCRKHQILPRNSAVAFFPTSCSTGDGIAALRSAVLAQLESMEQIWDSVPASFFTAKLRLQSMREAGVDILSFERWREVCRESGIESEEDRKDLLDLLRHLGLVVSFPHDARLQHLGVLNPEWVVRAIYPLLNSDKVVVAGGLLTHDDIERFLPGDRYPRETHGWLIALMQAFDLLFPTDAHQYLLPSRLPKEAPEWAVTGEWHEHPDVFHLELRYDVLPDSVIARFIVRNHSRSDCLGSWWRYGIAIREGPCRALVRAVPAERRIDIRMIGPRISRPAFLHGIRRDFRALTAHLGPEQLWVILLECHAEKYDELLLFAEQGYSTIPRMISGRVHEFHLPTILDLVETKHEQSDRAQRINMEVNLTMGDTYKNRDGILIGRQATVGTISANDSWKTLAAAGASSDQLATQLDELRIRAKDRARLPEQDIEIGKVAEAHAEAMKGNGPGALRKLKGVSTWLLLLAKEVGVEVAAKAIEAACGLSEA